jgi:DNA repair protein RecN (Recombination protein N)
MLSAVRIANFALIERAELTLGAGLTALTGETGAGKSILLDALAVVLGGRAHERVIRHGCDAAEMEAQFDEVRHPEVLQQLADLGIALEDDRLIARRVIARQTNKSRCWLAGRLVSVAQLRAILAPLVDLSSQHAQHRLLDKKEHLALLDRFAGNQALLNRYTAAYSQWRQTERALADLQAQIRSRADRMDFLRFVHKELSDLKLQDGEVAGLQDKLVKARSAEQVAKAVSDASAQLGQDGGVRDTAARLARALQRHTSWDERLGQFAERLIELESQAGELSWELAAFLRGMDRDEGTLHKAAERLDQLTRALKKYGGSEAAALQRLAEVSAELDADEAEFQLDNLTRNARQQRVAVEALATELTARRHSAGPAFAALVTSLVQDLGMPKAELRVAWSAVAEPGPSGLDDAELMLRANAGESEGQLAAVASGGELSRILLAVQRAAAEGTAGTAEDAALRPTAIYDEADAGLSGSTGLVLGRFLSDVAQQQQILVISHLPQVAAAADHHVRVWKQEQDGRTVSYLQPLQENERLDELARMLGQDDERGETARAHAAQLRTLQRQQ